MKLLGLNIGCGDVIADLERWVNVDVVPRRGALLIVDGEIPAMDDTFDGAVAHHVVQMIAWPELVPWLAEVLRVLKPGAALRVTVPNLLAAMNARHLGRRDWFPVEGETVDEKLCVYLSQNGATRSVFTPDALALLFDRAGFVGVCTRTSWADEHHEVDSYTDWLTALDSRLDESFILEGVKP